MFTATLDDVVVGITNLEPTLSCELSEMLFAFAISFQRNPSFSLFSAMLYRVSPCSTTYSLAAAVGLAAGVSVPVAGVVPPVGVVALA